MLTLPAGRSHVIQPNDVLPASKSLTLSRSEPMYDISNFFTRYLQCENINVKLGCFFV